ncbi:MAG: methyltransferase domain-containing protein [Bacteroidota bacterium]|nr:methyltransferase domain-containing protein [Bacteroidota bacterium]
MTISIKNFEAVAHISVAVMVDGQHSDKAFEAFFRKNHFLSETDKAFIVEWVNYIIRNWRLLSEIYNRAELGKHTDFMKIAGIAWIITGNTLPVWPVFKRIKSETIQSLHDELTKNRAIEHSVPDWIDKLGAAELGERWPHILKALNREPAQVLRVNTLKITKEQLKSQLDQKDVTTELCTNAPDGLVIKKKLNVFHLPEFKEGLFEMQDASSQMTGQFANPQPGMRVIDACAGNGGKTLHLAALMQNKGRIIALDLYPSKLETLKKRVRRAGISIIEPRPIESTKVIKRLYDSADLVLLDVPCSGLGVLKRNPEIKWRLQPSDFENLLKTQEDLLNRYSRMTKSGGRLVYCTCSIMPSENMLQVRKFLERQPEKFELTEELSISPEDGFDGFYMASLKRIG